MGANKGGPVPYADLGAPVAGRELRRAELGAFPRRSPSLGNIKKPRVEEGGAIREGLVSLCGST